MKKLFMFLSVVLLAFACSSDEDVLTGSIQGTVTEMIAGETLPIADVMVSIDEGSSVRTDNNGHYSFNDIDAKPYKLRFNKDGFRVTTRDVNVIAGKSIICDVTLESEKKDLITIEPSSLYFGTLLTELPITLVNNGTKDLQWNLDIGKNSNWLSVSPMTGIIKSEKSQSIIFSVNRECMTGKKMAIVNLKAGESTFPISIECDIDYGSPQMIVEPSNIDFGTNLSEQNLTIKNIGTISMDWKIKGEMNSCLALSENHGSVPSGSNNIIKLTLDRNKLTENLNTSFIITDGHDDRIVKVSALFSKPIANFVVEPSILDFGEQISELPFVIKNVGNMNLVWHLKNVNSNILSFNTKDGLISPNESKKVVVKIDRKNLKEDMKTCFIVTDGNSEITVDVFVKKGNTDTDTHEYVDLGLPSGVKWATCNIGASSPEEYGDYFAWGETKPKDSYSKENSETYGVRFYEPSISGDSKYDAARVAWGGKWRIPTLNEIKELVTKCKWSRTKYNNVEGMNVTGPNGKRIFLPAAGGRIDNELTDDVEYGIFWGATIELGDFNDASILIFNSYVNEGEFWLPRYCGLPIRPVLD